MQALKQVNLQHCIGDKEQNACFKNASMGVSG